MIKNIFIISFIILNLLFCSSVFAKGKIGQVPMYGGMDRSQNEELSQADEKLIQGTTKQFGSREKASMEFVKTAFRYYQQGNNEKAMARFNQAWIINPNNPEVYWGFSAILHDSGEYCEGFKMLELGLSKGALQSGYKPDLAALYAGCAMHGKQITENERQQYYQKSAAIFIEAENDDNVPKPYLYFQWARILNAQEKYPQAWEKVKQYREVTDRPFDKRLLRKLTKNMEEPE